MAWARRSVKPQRQIIDLKNKASWKIHEDKEHLSLHSAPCLERNISNRGKSCTGILANYSNGKSTEAKTNIQEKHVFYSTVTRYQSDDGFKQGIVEDIGVNENNADIKSHKSHFRRHLNTNGSSLDPQNPSNPTNPTDFTIYLNEARKLISEIGSMTEHCHYVHEPDICRDKIELVSFMINDLRQSQLDQLNSVEDVRHFISYAGDIKRIFDEYETLTVEKYIRNNRDDASPENTMSNLKTNIDSLINAVKNLDAHSADARLKHSRELDGDKSGATSSVDLKREFDVEEKFESGKALSKKIKQEVKLFEKIKDVTIIPSIVNCSLALIDLVNQCENKLKPGEWQSVERRARNIEHFCNDLSRIQSLPLQSKVKSFFYDVETLGTMIDRLKVGLTRKRSFELHLIPNNLLDLDLLKKDNNGPNKVDINGLDAEIQQMVNMKSNEIYKSAILDTVKQTMKEILCDAIKTLVSQLLEAKSRTSPVEEVALKKTFYAALLKMTNLPPYATKFGKYSKLCHEMTGFFSDLSASDYIVYGTPLVNKIGSLVDLLQEFWKYLETYDQDASRNQGKVLKHWLLVSKSRDTIAPFEKRNDDRRVKHIERVCKCKIHVLRQDEHPLYDRIPDGYRCVVIAYDEKKGNYYGSMKMIQNMFPNASNCRFLKHYKTLIRLPNGKKALLTSDAILLKTEPYHPPSRVACPRLLAWCRKMKMNMEDARSSFLSLPGIRSSRYSNFSNSVVRGRSKSSLGFHRDSKTCYESLMNEYDCY